MEPNNVVHPVNLKRETRMLGHMAGITRLDQFASGNLDIDVDRPATVFTEATSGPGAVLPADDSRGYLMKRQKH